MIKLFFIAIGGGIGALGRYAVSRYVYRLTGTLFPWGTMAVNVMGCFLIGFFFDVFDRSVLSSETKSLITIGFLGAFTTFSTYSLETLNLFKDGEIRLGAVNIVLSNILGIAAVVLGIIASRVLVKLLK